MFRLSLVILRLVWEHTFVQSDETSMTIEQLEREIAVACADLSARVARWLALVAEFDRRGGARRWGFRGTAEWLAWQCGLGRRAARDHVRVARALTTRPLIRAAFATGELSYSKVRAITRAPEGEDEAGLLELARSASAGQLERTVRALRSMPSADVDVANAAHARRSVDWWWEPDGSLAFSGRLPAHEGAAFVEAVESGAASLHGGPGSETVTPPPLGARRADALAEIMLSGAPRAQVVVHVDEPALACTARTAEARDGEICHIEDGPAIPSETARRLACDSEVVVARADDGGIDYGRKRRVVSPPLRASLERRDGCCRYPGCDRRHGLHAHHVRHWIHGGRTDRENLVLLCRYHHRLVHEEGFTVERSPSLGFRFMRPDGLVVPELREAAVTRPRNAKRAARRPPSREVVLSRAGAT
jgi:hypothetical protein